MSKPRINFKKGGYYHITNRTMSWNKLFSDDQDFRTFDKRVERFADECKMKIVVKSLMPTHYHLLIRQDGDITASKFAQKLSISYVKFYQKKYSYHGCLFGQRFSATAIADIYQMRNTTCYIHANAFKAGFVDDPRSWDYGDLNEFYSSRFWKKEVDSFLLDSFAGRAGFVDMFEGYINHIKLFAPVIRKNITADGKVKIVNNSTRGTNKKQTKKNKKKNREYPNQNDFRTSESRANYNGQPITSSNFYHDKKIATTPTKPFTYADRMIVDGILARYKK